MSRVMGAEIELVDEGFDIGIRESWERALDDVKDKGGKPYPIPAGASVHQVRRPGLRRLRRGSAQPGSRNSACRFDYIVVCTVTGSTHAGMVVGFAADGRAQRVIGIDASCTPEQTRAQVLDIAQQDGRTGGTRPRHHSTTTSCSRRTMPIPLYGVPSDETNDAIRLCARLEGMMTDPVYEGKSMQGMIDLVRTGFFPAGSKVLYAHLGGVPAINGYSYLYRNG